MTTLPDNPYMLIEYMDRDMDRVYTITLHNWKDVNSCADMLGQAGIVTTDSLLHFFEEENKGRLVRVTVSGTITYDNPIDALLLDKLSFNGLHITWMMTSSFGMGSKTIITSLRTFDEALESLGTLVCTGRTLPPIDKIVEAWQRSAVRSSPSVVLSITDNSGNVLYEQD